jgi:hypothetical protein
LEGDKIMKKIELAKTIGTFIVSLGVGAIVGNMIKATTPQSIGMVKKVSIAIGGFALSNMLGDMTANYTDNMIDKTVEQVEKMIEEVKEIKEESETDEKNA